MRMTQQQREMFKEAYRAIERGTASYPSFADLTYIFDLNYARIPTRRGAPEKYRARTLRGQTIVRRTWMRRFPAMFTKEARQHVL
jgi:hypothetical protein